MWFLQSALTIVSKCRAIRDSGVRPVSSLRAEVLCFRPVTTGDAGTHTHTHRRVLPVWGDSEGIPLSWRWRWRQ